MQGKYPVITLCGGTRFKNEFMEVQKKLTLEGNKSRFVEETNEYTTFME